MASLRQRLVIYLRQRHLSIHSGHACQNPVQVNITTQKKTRVELQDVSHETKCVLRAVGRPKTCSLDSPQHSNPAVDEVQNWQGKCCSKITRIRIAVSKITKKVTIDTVYLFFHSNDVWHGVPLRTLFSLTWFVLIKVISILLFTLLKSSVFRGRNVTEKLNFFFWNTWSYYQYFIFPPHTWCLRLCIMREIQCSL